MEPAAIGRVVRPVASTFLIIRLTLAGRSFDQPVCWVGVSHAAYSTLSGSSPKSLNQPRLIRQRNQRYDVSRRDFLQSEPVRQWLINELNQPPSRRAL